MNSNINKYITSSMANSKNKIGSISKKESQKSIFKYSTETDLQNIKDKVKNIMEYNSDEKNLLSYNLVIQYDKRTYCEYYISLIKTKHSLIFSFFNNNDYNSNIIKKDIFFVNFAVFYTLNG